MTTLHTDLPGRRIWKKYRALEKSCEMLMLYPRNQATRTEICRLLNADRVDQFAPGSLARGLAEEAQAHGDDLALRLDQGASDDLTIRAASAKLHQTLACLRALRYGHDGSAGWPLPIPRGADSPAYADRPLPPGRSLKYKMPSTSDTLTTLARTMTQSALRRP